MLDITEREKPDEIIHLGDHLRDAQTLAFAFPDIPMTRVPGNCDAWTGVPDRLALEREGVRILLAHGHQWGVKSGPDQALAAARAYGADILLYGHTHEAVCRREGSVLLLNPGTVGGRWTRATYGVIEIENGSGKPRIVSVK